MTDDGRDAKRLNLLRQTLQIEDAIAKKEREIGPARARRDVARRDEAERRAALKSIDAQIQSIGAQVHRRGSAVRLSGPSHDRGTLTVGNEALRFAGWRGHQEIPLDAIRDVQIGTAAIAPRSGIPFVEDVWPGEPRQTGTLLLTVRTNDDSSPHVEILAGLTDVVGWRDQIRHQQEQSNAIATWRVDLGNRREQAQVALDAATHARREADSQVSAVERELASLRDQLKQIQRETAKYGTREVDAALEQMIRTEHEAMRRLDET